jgi:hypothetical protein
MEKWIEQFEIKVVDIEHSGRRRWTMGSATPPRLSLSSIREGHAIGVTIEGQCFIIRPAWCEH